MTNVETHHDVQVAFGEIESWLLEKHPELVGYELFDCIVDEANNFVKVQFTKAGEDETDESEEETEVT